MISTNTIKPTVHDTPKRLRVIRADDVKSTPAFDFSGGQFKEVRPHASSFSKGPLQTSQMREMAENKARLAASAAKKLAQARAAASAKPKARRKGRKTKKTR